MKNTRNLHGTRCRARWAAAIALGAVVVLAPSPAWSQERGRYALSETPRPIVLSGGSIHEAGAFTPSLQRRVTFSFIPRPIGTSEGPVESLRVVVLQQNGRDGHDLVSYAWPDAGALGTYILRRSVMAASP